MCMPKAVGSRHALLLLLGAGLFPGAALAQDTGHRYTAGRGVYERWCAACHDPGITHPGTHALMVKYPGGHRATGVITEWTDLPASYVSFMVRHGISVMPQFRKTEITDIELDALAAYLPEIHRRRNDLHGPPVSVAAVSRVGPAPRPTPRRADTIRRSESDSFH